VQRQTIGTRYRPSLAEQHQPSFSLAIPAADECGAEAARAS
jgi:hypothetical protein